MGFGITGKSFEQFAVDTKFRKLFNSQIVGNENVDSQTVIDKVLGGMGKSVDDISGSLMNAAKAADKTGISFKAMGVGAKAASVGMKVLAAAGNMVAAALISFAITKAVQGIEYLANYADHMAENLENTKSKVEENESAIADMNKELENTEKLIKELEGLSDLTPIQKEQLDLAIQQREELERRLAVEQALLRVNQRQKNADYTKAFNTRTGGDTYRAVKAYNPELITKDMEGYGVDREFAKSLTFTTSGSGNNAVTHFTEAGLFEANKAAYKKNLEEIKKLRQDTFDAEAKGLDEAIIEYDKKIAKLEEENATLIGNMSEYVKNLQTAAEGISYIEGDRLTNQEKELNNRLDYTSYVGEAFADLENTERALADFEAVFEAEVFAEQAEQLKELAATGKLTGETLTTQFEGMMNEWRELGWEAEQVVEQINATVGQTATSPMSSSSTLASSLFTQTAAYVKLTEAIEEQNEAGQLSFATYEALIEANSEFADLLVLTADGWMLNTEAAWQYVEAQDEMNKLIAMVELEKVNDQLANAADLSQSEYEALMIQKAGWEQVITSITSATGALKKWQAAQDTPNQDAAFNEGETMYDTLKDGMKKGKTGTDDFQSAVDFMLGENWEENVGEGKTYKDKQAAYKAAEKKAKRYYGQTDERTGMKNFRDDLVKNEFGTLVGDVFTLNEGVTLEQMAEKLEMSVDSVKAMFGLMQAYGGEFKFEVDTSGLTEEHRQLVENAETIEECKEAQSELAEAKEYQQSIIDDPKATADAKTAAQQKIDEIDKTNAALESQIDMLSGVEDAAGTLTLDEALVKIKELEAAITLLSETGIKVPVTLTEQYDALNDLLSSLGTQGTDAEGNTGYTLVVNGVDDAKTKLEAIQTALTTIQNMPNIPANIEAQVTGVATEMINQLTSLIETGGTEQPVAITVSANTDQFDTSMGAAQSPEGGYTATITAVANTEQAESDINNFTAKERTADVTVRYVDPDGNVINEQTEVPNLIDSPSGNVVNTEATHTNPDGTSMTVDYTGAIDKGQSLITSANASGIEGIDAFVSDLQVAQVALYSALNAFEAISGLGYDPETDQEAYTEAMKWLASAYQEYLTAYNELDTVVKNGVEQIPNDTTGETGQNIVDALLGGTAVAEEAEAYLGIKIDEQTFENSVDDAVDQEWPVLEVPIDTPKIKETVEEAVEDEPPVVTTEVETEIVPPPSPDFIGPMPSVDFVANTSKAESDMAALEDEIETEADKPVGLDTSEADSQYTSWVSKLTQKVKKTVEVVYTGIKNTFASGTKSAPGGPSIVDDGTGSNAGAELIIHNSRGTYELGSGDGPRVTNLDPGDTVYTAKQTKTILSRMAQFGGYFRDGLNNTLSKGKAIIGKAFATGVSGSMSWAAISSALSSSSKNKNSSSSKSSGSWKKYVEKLFDWIEIRLERLQTQTDKWVLAASEAIGYLSKNAEFDKALASTSQQIDETTQAYQRYVEQAEMVAKKSKLSADIVQKIQEGTIDIASYSDSTKEKIEAYQEWYEKAMGCVEALTELREQERELASSKLDSILDHYQWRVDRLDAIVSSSDAMLDLKGATGIQITEDDYTKSIDATEKKIAELTSSKNALETEFKDMVSRGYIVEGSELWYEYTGELESLDETVIKTKVDLQELVDAANQITLTNLQYALTALENSATIINQMMTLHDAQGVDPSKNDYEDLISNGMAQIKNLEEQNKELRKQQQGLDVQSEKYQELEDQIISNDEAILDLKISQEQWNDSVLDLKITELERYRDSLSKTNEEYQKQKDLQQAIEDLERARTQRTQRVFREGQGFVWEADQDAVLEAQQNLENVVQDQLLGKIDDLIEAIEDAKADTNVYDANGVLLGEKYTLPTLGDYSELLKTYSSSDVVTSAMADAKKAAYEQVLSGIVQAQAGNTIQIGDIVVQGVDSVDSLAQAILDEFPNAMLQAMHSKT